jgi:hypothetical protein
MESPPPIALFSIVAAVLNFNGDEHGELPVSRKKRITIG